MPSMEEGGQKHITVCTNPPSHFIWYLVASKFSTVKMKMGDKYFETIYVLGQPHGIAKDIHERMQKCFQKIFETKRSILRGRVNACVSFTVIIFI